MKFQNPSITVQKFQISPKSEKNQSKFQNSVILPKFDGKFSKVNQVICFLAATSIPNMKALAQILFEISCTQDFQFCFQRDITQKRGITWT